MEGCKPGNEEGQSQTVDGKSKGGKKARHVLINSGHRLCAHIYPSSANNRKVGRITISKSFMAQSTGPPCRLASILPFDTK